MSDKIGNIEPEDEKIGLDDGMLPYQKKQAILLLAGGFSKIFLVVVTTFLETSVIANEAIKKIGLWLREDYVSGRFASLLVFYSLVMIGFGFLIRRSMRHPEVEHSKRQKKWHSRFTYRPPVRKGKISDSRIFESNLLSPSNYSSRLFQGKITEDWRDFLLTARSRYLNDADRLARNSAYNISLGVIISAIAIATLFILALGDAELTKMEDQSGWSVFLPRLTFALLIQSLGIFFLRRHTVNECERQRCNDMVTQIEFRLSAGALLNGDTPPDALVAALSSEKIISGPETMNTDSNQESAVVVALLAALARKRNENG